MATKEHDLHGKSYLWNIPLSRALLHQIFPSIKAKRNWDCFHHNQMEGMIDRITMEDRRFGKNRKQTKMLHFSQWNFRRKFCFLFSVRSLDKERRKSRFFFVSYGRLNSLAWTRRGLRNCSRWTFRGESSAMEREKNNNKQTFHFGEGPLECACVRVPVCFFCTMTKNSSMMEISPTHPCGALREVNKANLSLSSCELHIALIHSFVWFFAWKRFSARCSCCSRFDIGLGSCSRCHLCHTLSKRCAGCILMEFTARRRRDIPTGTGQVAAAFWLEEF